MDRRNRSQNRIAVRNAVSQLHHAEKNNLPIDHDEVEAEMYPPAEETPEESEVEN